MSNEVAALLSVCPLTKEERAVYKRCLFAEMRGVRCETCRLLPTFRIADQPEQGEQEGAKLIEYLDALAGTHWREWSGEECKTLLAMARECIKLRAEVDRLSTCHVCGDCLDIEDGRCELHANIEDETDYWNKGGERFECGCSWCKANEALNAAKEKEHG